MYGRSMPILEEVSVQMVRCLDWTNHPPCPPRARTKQNKKLCYSSPIILSHHVTGGWCNSGSNTSSLDAEEWIQLHSQIALLSSRSAEVAVELVFSAATKECQLQVFWCEHVLCMYLIHTYVFMYIYKAEHIRKCIMIKWNKFSCVCVLTCLCCCALFPARAHICFLRRHPQTLTWFVHHRP